MWRWLTSVERGGDGGWGNLTWKSTGTFPPFSGVVVVEVVVVDVVVVANFRVGVFVEGRRRVVWRAVRRGVVVVLVWDVARSLTPRCALDCFCILYDK